MPAEILVDSHPLDEIFRADRLPHIWCPGCGLGPAMACYAQAIVDSGIPLDKHVIVAGIGCTGRVPGYLNIDSYHTTHGRPLPFATGMKVSNPELQVTVFSGDGDIFAIGGNHLLHAARRNIDINLFCVNNFNYGMTGGQAGPTTPMGARASTAPYGCFESAFNMPWLAASLGAVYVARWTALHVRQLKNAMSRAMEKRGFSFIEILSPCPIGFGRPNNLGEGLDEMHLYQEECIVDHDADLAKAGIDLRQKEPIILGNFVDTERPIFTTVPEQFRG
jgi:2-oxoglutarate ferredoxin oxidoreductase subunit beta